MAYSKLTARQRKLIQFPPKPDTWECRTPECKAATGGSFNPMKRGTCWCCGTPRRRIARRTPYMEYLEACKAAGIEPIPPKEG